MNQPSLVDFLLLTAFPNVMSIFFLSIVTIPIVRWSYNWNRDFGFYYPLVFLFIVTPVLLLIIKGKIETEKSTKLPITLSNFILYYVWINIGCVFCWSIADFYGMNYDILNLEVNLGIILYLTVYTLIYSLIRKRFISIEK